MEQQLKEAVGGERKMSELIAFLLQGRSSVCLLVVVLRVLTSCCSFFWFLIFDLYSGWNTIA